MLGRTDRRGRLLVLLVAVLLLGSAASARLAYWQVVDRARLAGLAMAQLQSQAVLPAQRGAIYDRTGTVLFATTAYRDELIAYPDEIPPDERPAIAGRLAAILGLDSTGAAAMAGKLASGSGYTVLDAELTPDQSDAVRRGLADGTLTELDLVPHPVRVYPDPGGAPGTTLASQLLGFVNRDGQGQYGVEQRYQALLGGRDRLVVAERDAAGRLMADTEHVTDPGAPGTDLRLTLDAGLQLSVEKELYAAWIADQAASVSAVVMDASTGAILSWASVPGYDANAYGTIAAKDPSQFIDPLASRVYEPGSVMKMLVATAAYEGRVVKPTTRINDSGVMRVANGVIADADRAPMGWIPFQDIIAYSRNVGAARVARMLGGSLQSASERLYDVWSRLGIAQPTGVDIAGEIGGLTTDPAVAPWTEIDLANHAFGQGVAVTLIQLARAFAAMANGGTLVTPHVVAQVGDQPARVPAPERVLDPSLSSQLTTLMRHVVTAVPWYAQGTLIPGYDVGGKTGTAQIWDAKKGQWIGDRFDFTFVGYLGRNKPELVVAVLIDHGKPNIIAQGVFQQKITSYELFRRIGRDAIQALDLTPLPKPSPGHSPVASPAAGSPSSGAGSPTPNAASPPSLGPPSPTPSFGSGEVPGGSPSPFIP